MFTLARRVQLLHLKARVIDPFKVNAAILQRVQIHWAERKIYSKCVEKAGS